MPNEKKWKIIIIIMKMVMIVPMEITLVGIITDVSLEQSLGPYMLPNDWVRVSIKTYNDNCSDSSIDSIV